MTDFFYLVDAENPQCEICGEKFKNVRGLSQHCRAHNLTSKEYTFKYLLKGSIPKCKCGCEKECLYYPFKYSIYRSGHNPLCLWQNRLNPNSAEYQEIVDKIKIKLSDYYLKNPKIISDEQKREMSEYMKSLLSDPEERKRRFSKMKETKKRQSESGILSKNHWTKKLSPEELDKKLAEISILIQESKRKNKQSAWNKGLTIASDSRILKWSGENNYRYNASKKTRYSRKFRNKEYRKMLLEQQNSVCFKCNSTDGRQLCLHHVDEDKANDSYENLIFVCRSCHIRLHSIPAMMEDMKMKVTDFKNEIKKEKRWVISEIVMGS